MSEEQECCIIGACCDPQKRMDALQEKIEQDLGFEPHTAKKIAKWIREHYDLAPVGTVQPLIDAIAEMAREYPYER